MVTQLTWARRQLSTGGQFALPSRVESPAANLTPRGIGHYTEADFVRALREGVPPAGAAIDSQMPVRRITRHLDDIELRARFAYLHTLPSRPYGGR